jgi:hypothetical protein
MALDGRIEKRIPVEVPMYLAGANEAHPTEQVVTENVSPRGARVRTKQPLRPGDQHSISSSSLEFHLPVRVVYCQRRSNRNFCVGLELGRRVANWWKLRMDRRLED